MTHYLAVPEELIQIHSSVELTRMTFKIPDQASTW